MKNRKLLIIWVSLILCASVATGLAQQTTSSQPPFGHHMGPPPASAVCTDGKYLFVVIGPKIHVYTVPDLTLQNTAELPRPAPPVNK